MLALEEVSETVSNGMMSNARSPPALNGVAATCSSAVGWEFGRNITNPAPPHASSSPAYNKVLLMSQPRILRVNHCRDNEIRTDGARSSIRPSRERGTDLSANYSYTVWQYWNLTDCER
jgi:hypothetical protein